MWITRGKGANLYRVGVRIMFVNLVAHCNQPGPGNIARACLDPTLDMLGHPRVDRADDQCRDMSALRS